MKIEIVDPSVLCSLRHRVLWPHIEKTEDCVIDIDHREDAIHLAAYDDNVVVGVCSLFEMKTPKLDFNYQYRLRAMATDPNVRGTGVGKAIVHRALEILAEKDCELLWCDARKVALGFYENLDFLTIDEWYEVRNIGPHKTMYHIFEKKQD